MATSNDRLELIDPHQGLLCRMRTNDEPIRCGAKGAYIHHFDLSGPKSTRHYATALCMRHAETVATALKIHLPLETHMFKNKLMAVSWPELVAESSVMTGAQAVAAMTGTNKPMSERIALELVMFIRQQESLANQIQIGIERCRTMLRILKESNERRSHQ